VRDGTLPPYRRRKLHRASAWPPRDNYPSARPLKVHRPKDHQLPPSRLAQAPPRKHLAAAGQLPTRPPARDRPTAGPPASPIQAAQSPPLELRPPRGRQPPPGARTVRNLIACSCHRTGHDTGPTSSSASRHAPPMQLRAAPPYSLHRAVKPSPSASLPPRRLAPRKLLARLRPTRARSSPRRRRGLPTCKAGVAALEPAAKQPAPFLQGRPRPVPHPPAHLMSLRLPAAVSRPMQLRAAPPYSLHRAVKPSPSASLPPRRLAPRKLLARLLPPALDHLLVAVRAFHPVRPGWPPWSLRPNSRPPFLQGRPRPFHTHPPF